LKPEWWGSPLAQGEKYQGRKKTCDDDINKVSVNNKKAIKIMNLVIQRIYWQGERLLASQKALSYYIEQRFSSCEARPCLYKEHTYFEQNTGARIKYIVWQKRSLVEI
jgi:hypothetical protein